MLGHNCIHVLLTFVSTLIVDAQPPPQVTLIDGSPVEGKFSNAATGKQIVEFLGIPYAEPPTGRHRFGKPRPKAPWRDTLRATDFSNSCVQTPDNAFGEFHGATMWNANTRMSEDCLYLNVWVPDDIDLTRKRSVMVWIFGGGFWSGTSSLDVYDGKILSTEEDVIIVSMNYRVTVFGFLYLGREEAPGNVGLWDQSLALKWVKQNIALFGGDPDTITIFGESAGGASVTMHMLSPRSQPYFHRAITQSGSATSPWALEPQDVLKQRAMAMGHKLGCEAGHVREPSTWDFDKLLDCFMTKSWQEIRDHEWVITNGFLDFPWTPVIDLDFFIEHPLISLQRGHFKNTQLLAGSNSEEANFFIVYQLDKLYNKRTMFEEEEFIMNDTAWVHYAQQLMPVHFKRNPVVRSAILHEYRDWSLPGSALKRQDGLDKLTGDYFFSCNVNEFAQYFSDHGGQAWYYYFTHRSSVQTWPKWMGVLHGYEINFIFGEPLNDEHSYTVDEQALSRKFMHYWANFAKTGNPNRHPSDDKDYTELPVWPPYDRARQQYMTMSVEDSSIGVGPRRQQCTFWKDYLPSLFTATKSYTSTMDEWRRSFERWHTEYLPDWAAQFELYKKYQTYRRMDAEMADEGSCGRP